MQWTINETNSDSGYIIAIINGGTKIHGCRVAFNV